MPGKITLLIAVLSCLSACNFQRGDARAPEAASEPPVACSLDRGEWCLLDKGYVEAISDVPDGPSILNIAADFWADEYGVIIEGAACGQSNGAKPVISGQDPDFLWNQLRWRKVSVDFGGSPSCTVHLLAPVKSRAQLDMAASVISANFAYCGTSHPCHPQLLAYDLFSAFRELGLDSRSHPLDPGIGR